MNSLEIWRLLYRAAMAQLSPRNLRVPVPNPSYHNYHHINIAIFYHLGFILHIDAFAPGWFLRVKKKEVVVQHGDPDLDLVWLKFKL